MHCKNCGEPMNDIQAICLKCGVKKGQGNSFCPNCGHAVEPGAEYCLGCGISLKSTGAQLLDKGKAAAASAAAFVKEKTDGKGKLALDYFNKAWSDKKTRLIMIAAAAVIIVAIVVLSIACSSCSSSIYGEWEFDLKATRSANSKKVWNEFKDELEDIGDMSLKFGKNYVIIDEGYINIKYQAKYADGAIYIREDSDDRWETLFEKDEYEIKGDHLYWTKEEHYYDDDYDYVDVDINIVFTK